MLTINADGHCLMQKFHKPTDEKRMVVVLPEDQYQDWLAASSGISMRFMQPYAVELCVSSDVVVPNQTTLWL